MQGILQGTIPNLQLIYYYNQHFLDMGPLIQPIIIRTMRRYASIMLFKGHLIG